MKIGLSFSRCLRDIYEGKVDESDVLVIIARTDIDPHNDNHWDAVWDGYLYGGYSKPEWSGYKDCYDDFRRLAIRLYDTGKLHQPRQFGAHPPRMPYYWLDCVVPIEELEELPSVKQAWEHYQMVANLCS
jgi:hypothetical protein